MIDDKNFVRRRIRDEEIAKVWIQRFKNLPIRTIDHDDFAAGFCHINFVVARVDREARELLTPTGRKRSLFSPVRFVLLGPSMTRKPTFPAPSVLPTK